MRKRAPGSQSEYFKKYYEKNRQEMIDRAKANKQILRNKVIKMVWQHLQNHPCVDCGETDPVVLEFDHRGDKEFQISDSLRGDKSLKRVEAEIAKCDVRCCNCHRRKTYAERGLKHRTALSHCW